LNGLKGIFWRKKKLDAKVKTISTSTTNGIVYCWAEVIISLSEEEFEKLMKEKKKLLQVKKLGVKCMIKSFLDDLSVTEDELK